MFPALACAAFLLRAGVGLSKYAVWAIMAVAIQYARRATSILPPDQRIAWPAWGWPLASLVFGSAVFAMGYSQARKQARAEAKAAELLSKAE